VTTTIYPTRTGYQRKQVETTAMARQEYRGRTPLCFNTESTAATTMVAERSKRGQENTGSKMGKTR
jgi:hypothetical protein